jgi:hypothetical protein
MDEVVESGERGWNPVLDINWIFRTKKKNTESLFENSKDPFNNISSLSMVQVEKFFFIFRALSSKISLN